MPGNFSDMQGSGIIFRSCFSPPLSDDNVQSFPFLLFLLLVTLAWALLLTPPLSSFMCCYLGEERRGGGGGGGGGRAFLKLFFAWQKGSAEKKRATLTFLKKEKNMPGWKCNTTFGEEEIGVAVIFSLISAKSEYRTWVENTVYTKDTCVLVYVFSGILKKIKIAVGLILLGKSRND